jgi:5-formyltetrahydrofolate cyclo-ligase
MNAHSDKESLRRIMRQVRTSRSSVEHARRSQAICKHLSEVPEVVHARRVFAYWPMVDRGEVDIRPWLRQAQDRGCEIWLPIVEGSRIRHRRFVSEDELKPGSFGQLEPTGMPEEPEEYPELVIVPGLAADSRGNRLGYGGGFYDRFLATLPLGDEGSLVVMPIFAQHVIERVPIQADDIPVHKLVTEDGTCDCTK